MSPFARELYSRPSRLLCAAVLLTFAWLAPAALAQENPDQNKLIVNDPDDRITTVPVNAFTITHQSTDDVANTINTQNGRIVDFAIEQLSPTALFTVTYVTNTGPYYKGWYVYLGLDANSLATTLQTTNGRLTALKAYDAGGGQIRYIVIIIPNTGKDSKPWWYLLDATPDQIAAALAANGARPTLISPYTLKGTTHYAAVMVAQGPNDPATYWYTDVSAAQIAANSQANNNARLIDLESVPLDGNFTAIMTDCLNGCPNTTFYTGQTEAQMQALINPSVRLTATSTDSSCQGSLCYAFVVVDNSLPALDTANAISTRVGNLLRAGGVDGVQGLYLKQVGGPVLANVEEDFVFEPASSIKVVAHLYAVTQVQSGAASLTQQMQQYTNGPESCPDPAQLGEMEPLSTTLREMMWHSDNARTREVTDTFGAPNINLFAQSIGMAHTQINHIIGCGGPVPDRLSLTDAAALYEGVANGTLLTPDNVTTFTSLMAGKAQFQTEGYDWTHLWDTDIPNIIVQSAPNASAAQRASFQNLMSVTYKAGNYDICGSSCSNITEYYAIAGWFGVPFCATSGDLTTASNQNYVFGMFLNGGTDNSWSAGKNTLTLANFTAARGELMREQIAAGLQSCGIQ